MSSTTATVFLPLFLGIFVLTWLILPTWIKRAKNAELQGKDIHKFKERNVAEMGGIVVLLTFMIGIMGYIAVRVFIFNTNSNVTSLFALLVAVLIAGIIGIMDDILGWKIGLRQWQKPLLTLLAAAPIMAINAGSRVMSLPFVGQVDLGLLYPLIMIPIIIAVSTNGFNMLAGFNGLEAGQGILILGTLAILSFNTGTSWLSVVALCMIFALLGFLMYNHFPSKIFPGDSLTYTVGALIGIIAVVANLEKAFLILFIPYIIQFFLKLRGMFQKESFAQIQEDGTLKPKYKKIYGLENLCVKFQNILKLKTTEKSTVYWLYAFQLIFVVIALVI
ncbi:glycosyl transferase family 4 [Candidatus Woesearchaeota archaeon]|jgi:UDP-N-acetylglucosamine--dolichyl-phosphate N-acetylglucosaminephosphotransferase|nr:glycosyl transferase family 4 [Candidatus Woesearchaeota archaeon]